MGTVQIRLHEAKYFILHETVTYVLSSYTLRLEDDDSVKQAARKIHPLVYVIPI